jgi:hypothetical protein
MRRFHLSNGPPASALGIDVLAVLGRSCLFLFHALLGRGGIGGGFGCWSSSCIRWA